MATQNNDLSIVAFLLKFREGFNTPESNQRLRDLAIHDDLLDLFSSSDLEWANEQLESHRKLGIHVISILDPVYPYLLRLIPDPPTVLFVKGNLDLLLFARSVAIVGSRNASPNGIIIARRIASFLAEAGWVITSGLALGIDAAAHRGCMDVGGNTVAVLAHGLEKAQPKQNEKLAHAILEKGGVWMSEHPIGTHARPDQFVQRNRLQIGISAGSIIVEAGLKSGSATQARFCKAQNRPLFAVVPQSPENTLGLHSEGTIEFVKSSDAYPIKSKDDYQNVETILKKSLERLFYLGTTNGPSTRT